MARIDELIGYGTHAARPAAGSAGSLYYETDTDSIFRDNGTTWDALTLAGGGGGSLTVQSNYLSADVSMPSANTFYDGPSLSCAAGTWLLMGSIYFVALTSNGNWVAKLWDGTTVVTSNEISNISGMAAPGVDVAGIVTPTTTTTYKISGACTGAGNKMAAALSDLPAGNTASYLLAIQVA